LTGVSIDGCIPGNRQVALVDRGRSARGKDKARARRALEGPGGISCLQVSLWWRQRKWPRQRKRQWQWQWQRKRPGQALRGRETRGQARRQARARDRRLRL